MAAHPGETPAVAPEQVAGSSTAPKTSTRKGRSRREHVVIASPFDDDLLALLRIMARANLESYWWTGCTEAVSTLRDEPAPVVICEAQLHDGTWRDLLERTEQLPEPPMVIVASRLADDVLWAEALNLGAYDVLAKPFCEDEVLRVLGAACRAWQGRRDARKSSGSLAKTA